jgi:uncharacterized protein YkwD
VRVALASSALYGNYECPRSVSAARFRPLFLNLIRRHLEPLAGDSDRVTGIAIIHEINIARQNPTVYATFLEPTRQKYAGRVCLMPGSVRVCTREGVRAVEEAIRFLRRARPLPPLALSPGLCSAADHCREQAGGAVGHHGRDGSDPGNRISSSGVVAQGWAENIAYGQHSARAIVMALIIDDGVRSRGHRRNIFNANFKGAGAAYGPHARYGRVCSIDFASGYVESTFAHAGPMPRSRFNDVTPVIGRDAADFALFRESVERMDQP